MLLLLPACAPLLLCYVLRWLHCTAHYALQGVLATVAALVAERGPLLLPALRLLVALCHGNSFVKNCARAAGLVPLLVDVVRHGGGAPGSNPDNVRTL